MDTEFDAGPYIVLINDEEQYSLWAKRIRIPAGWKAVGPEGSKDECLKYIDSVWTDMRPRSLRLAMEAQVERVRASAITH